ncbi:hypothetical protein [Endozoicomonas sp.]|uniref:hypothetical protein n=1 Tax=Endozoicomonas sp. TaxID=1892382 RepID=UPI00288484B6|nr:hypothetical protein [Endozoicomonas sp.]
MYISKQSPLSTIITIDNNEERIRAEQGATFIGRCVKQLKTKPGLFLTIATACITETLAQTALEYLLPIDEQDSYYINFLKNLTYNSAVVLSSGIAVALTTLLMEKLPRPRTVKSLTFSPGLAQTESTTKGFDKKPPVTLTTYRQLPSIINQGFVPESDSNIAIIGSQPENRTVRVPANSLPQPSLLVTADHNHIVLVGRSEARTPAI